jgi:hypothetical protein
MSALPPHVLNTAEATGGDVSTTTGGLLARYDRRGPARLVAITVTW